MSGENLSAYLTRFSKQICEENACTDEHHNCESYAYIRPLLRPNGHDVDLILLDVCASDFFVGCSKPYAAVPLPWDGSEDDLKEEVLEQAYEMGFEIKEDESNG